MQSTGVAILGSTGSIGCNSLRVIESLSNRRMRVVAWQRAATWNGSRIRSRRTCRKLFQSITKAAAHDLRAMLFARNIDLPRIVTGEAGLVEVATHPEADCVDLSNGWRDRFCADAQSARMR